MEQWILDLTKELQIPPPDRDDLHTTSIYRVPKILTDVNSQAYEPKLASFGPYHHHRPHLQPMDQHKHRALIQFLRRISKSSKTPDDVLIAMRKVEARVLASYDSLHDWLKEKDEFLKLMIVDGCFALEVMKRSISEEEEEEGEQSEYDLYDPVFGAQRKNYIIPDLKRDMLLLENQIPLLVLTTLAAIDGSGIGDVRDLIIAFYNLLSSTSPKDRMKESLKARTNQSLHILDLYRKILTAKGDYLPSYEANVQSATVLRNAGVSFCKSNSNSYRDISFNGGVLSLPPLEIDDTTESTLLNLMAFERLHATADNEVTAYAFFMDGLIDTTDDVALLRANEIIMGWVGGDGNITSLFNKITKEATLVVFKEDIEVDVNGKLNRYCRKRMHRWRASFVETYFKNPWVFISLLGGLFLLALTIIQTVYSMLQFYQG